MENRRVNQIQQPKQFSRLTLAISQSSHPSTLQVLGPTPSERHPQAPPPVSVPFPVQFRISGLWLEALPITLCSICRHRGSWLAVHSNPLNAVPCVKPVTQSWWCPQPSLAFYQAAPSQSLSVSSQCLFKIFFDVLKPPNLPFPTLILNLWPQFLFSSLQAELLPSSHHQTTKLPALTTPIFSTFPLGEVRD